MSEVQTPHPCERCKTELLYKPNKKYCSKCAYQVRLDRVNAWHARKRAERKGA